jgi:antitoxin VapB
LNLELETLMDEYTTKHDRLMQLMEQHNVDAIHLAKSANVAWASGGKRVYIDIASEEGIASLLITRDRRYLLTNNIEAERLRTEEGFADWEIVAEPWYEQETQLQQLTKGMRLAADSATANAVDVGDNLIELRAPLTPPEVERYRALGHDAGAALGQVARQITPGMTEDEVAARIAAASYAVGAVPVVVLVVADERMDTIRHPLPTGKRIDRRTMMVLCALRNGLIANLTRIVHFGPIPAETQRRMEAVTRIEATAIAATRPGAHIRDIFARIQGAYADTGFADEWRNHHQGGACSYGSRDYIATPDCDELVRAPQAFAWNPSVPGAKSEDTVLVSDGGFEVLTPSPDWPMLRLEIDGIEIERPTILEL